MTVFTLDEQQIKKLKKWSCYKRCKKNTKEGAIGGRLTYSFTPVGLGVAVAVSCNCGNMINLTDYESW